MPGLARVTFSDEMSVYLGGKEVRAHYYGRGHTGGDAVMYFPADKVIHTGDLFLTFPPQPFIDYANGGSALEWTKTLDGVLKLDFDIAIPGHGPVSDRAGILKFRKRLPGHARSHPRHGARGREQRRDFEGAGGRLSLGRGRTGGPAGGCHDCGTEVIMSLVSRLLGRFWKLPAPITRDIASRAAPRPDARRS